MFRRYVLPCLQLCRFAAVFTAIADICAGLALTGQLTPWKSANSCLIAASACLYLSGMVLNDYFDRRIDAVERPRRPIPSGRVSPRAAAWLGGTLLAAGIGCAALAGTIGDGTGQPFLISLAIGTAILAYDGVIKGTWAGPVVMGSCRFLNLLLGASLAVPHTPGFETRTSNFQAVWSAPQLLIAGAMWLYIIGVTLYARGEAGQSRRGTLALAIALLDIGLAFQATILWFSAGASSHRLRTLTAIVMVAIVINRAAVRGWTDPQPRTVQMGVRTMLQWIIILDAVFVYHAHPDPRLAIAVAALLLPAKLLGRYLAIT